MDFIDWKIAKFIVIVFLAFCYGVYKGWNKLP
jgi:hypothetical protein